MKAVASAAILMMWAGVALAADPAEGVWKSLADDNGNSGHIRIATCGHALCGTLILSFDGTGADAKRQRRQADRPGHLACRWRRL